MSKRPSELRLFVGIYPPHEACRSMLAALDKLDLPSHRRTPPEQVHLTLLFIGDVLRKNLDATIESIERAYSGLKTFELSTRSLIRLPERGPARLIAMETDYPATLRELQRRLAARLAGKPRPRAGDRFRPHLTLCRFRAPSKVSPPEPALDRESFVVARIVLMRSELLPTGAAHHEVESFPLIPV